MSYYVSIIVPTYRNWQQLISCIEALTGQSYPKNHFEVIIINNDTSDPPPREFLLPENFKLIEEPKSGSYAARNAGLKTATGEIIGFTDSDCIPDSDWIKNAVDYLKENKECCRVAGPIEIIRKHARPSIIQKYNQLYAFPQKNVIDHTGGSMTANLFTYRHVFSKVGNFDETFLSYGDLEWGSRANKAGFPINYIEKIVVFHPPRTLGEIIVKEKRLGGGVAMFYKTKHSVFFNIIKFCYQFRPRIGALRHVLSDKGSNASEIFLIPILKYYLNIIRAYEILRVSVGKLPRRV